MAGVTRLHLLSPHHPPPQQVKIRTGVVRLEKHNSGAAKKLEPRIWSSNQHLTTLGYAGVQGSGVQTQVAHLMTYVYDSNFPLLHHHQEIGNHGIYKQQTNSLS